MPTIASQIERIQKATNQLRTKGIGLELNVSDGEALSNNHKLDDVAKAFDSIVFSKGETKNVELKVTQFKEDGTIAGNSYTLPTGFYKGLTIKPFFTQTSSDEVLNIRTLSQYPITSPSGTITPGEGYNYIDLVEYNVQLGKINTVNSGYNNNSVTAKVGTAGWLNLNSTTNVTVPTATITRQVGSNAATTLSDASTTETEFIISPNRIENTVLTIASGIYASERTITVQSLKSQMGNATVASGDILYGKIAYGSGGVPIQGTMPNYGGTAQEIFPKEKHHIEMSSGEILVVPYPGYYNAYSRISTGITAGTATYKQTQDDLAETNHKFEIKPADDEDNNITTYLTQITVDNSLIYEKLAAI